MDLKLEIPPKYEINLDIWLDGPVNLTRGEFLLWCREAKSTFFFFPESHLRASNFCFL